MPAASAAAVGSTTTTAAGSTTAATEAGAATRGITAGLAAVVIAAEAAGAGAGLAAGLIESPRGLSISMERRVPPAGMVINIRGAALHVGGDAALAAAAVVIVAVVKRIAAGVVAVIVINYVAAAPAYAPMAPAPSVAAVEADAEADSTPIKRRAAPPDSGVGIPTGPGRYGIPVHQPRIIGGDIDHVRCSRLNDDIRALRLDGLLLRVLQIAGLLRFLAHHLNRVHYVLFLVVVGVTERRGPGDIFVHVSQHGGERAEGFHAGVPGLLVHGLGEGVALQIGIGLHPAVGFDDLRWKSGRRQNLRHERVRIERDRRYQLIQLVGSLRGIGRRRSLRAVRSLRRRLGLLRG